MVTVISSPARKWIIAGALAIVLLFPTLAARADGLDGPAFRTVIGAQVEAFRRDDWAEAFGYASPTIRRMFGTPDRFRSMVMNGYEAVARPRIFEFETPTVVDGRPAQPVFVVGPDGVARRALYFMQRQSDGRWLIDGCVLLAVEERTT